MPSLLQIYSNNLSNMLVTSSIEFLVKQLYILHRSVEECPRIDWEIPRVLLAIRPPFLSKDMVFYHLLAILQDKSFWVVRLFLA